MRRILAVVVLVVGGLAGCSKGGDQGAGPVGAGGAGTAPSAPPSRRGEPAVPPKPDYTTSNINSKSLEIGKRYRLSLLFEQAYGELGENAYIGRQVTRCVFVTDRDMSGIPTEARLIVIAVLSEWRELPTVIGGESRLPIFRDAIVYTEKEFPSSPEGRAEASSAAMSAAKSKAAQEEEDREARERAVEAGLKEEAVAAEADKKRASEEELLRAKEDLLTKVRTARSETEDWRRAIAQHQEDLKNARSAEDQAWGWLKDAIVRSAAARKNDTYGKTDDEYARREWTPRSERLIALEKGLIEWSQKGEEAWAKEAGEATDETLKKICSDAAEFVRKFRVDLEEARKKAEAEGR